MTNSSNPQIANSQRAIAAFVSLIRGENVKVVWGKEASSNASGIVNLPRPKTGHASEVALLTRLAIHESGHHEFTDFNAIISLTSNELIVLNALEDPRIESEQVKKFPGASLMLNRGLAPLLLSFIERSGTVRPEDVARMTLMNIIVRGYLKVAPHQAFREHGHEILALGDPLLGTHVIDAIERATDALKLCTTTTETCGVAKRLWAEMQPPKAEEPPTQTPSEEEEDGEQSPDQDATENGEHGGDSTSAAAPTEQKPEAPNAPPNEGANDGDFDGSSQESGVDSTAQADETDNAVDKVAGANSGGDTIDGPPGQMDQGSEAGPSGPAPMDLSSATGEDMGTLIEQAYADQFGAPDVDTEGVPEDSTEVNADLVQSVGRALESVAEGDDPIEQVLQAVQDHLDGQDLEQALKSESASSQFVAGGNASGALVSVTPDVRMTGVVSRLVRVFLGGLQDKRHRPVKMGPAGGQVAANRVWRLKKLGDSNIFRVRKPMSGIDAAVTILLDRSGSMDNDIVEASQAALACAQALERISKVKTSIEMFPAKENDPKSTMTLQRFGESARQVAKRCSAVDAGGGTPLTEALKGVIPVLLEQRCEKRMLIIITDGVPNNTQSAIAEIVKAQALGIEVMGIGMGSHCKIERITQNSVHISGVSGLPDAVEQLFGSHIVQRLAA